MAVTIKFLLDNQYQSAVSIKFLLISNNQYQISTKDKEGYQQDFMKRGAIGFDQ